VHLRIDLYQDSHFVTAAILHTKGAYYLSNGIGAVKLLTLVFIAITGWVVLGGHTEVENPKAHFQNAFEGTATPYGVTNALYRIIFSYAGYNNAFNVINEIKVRLLLRRVSDCVD
jgi:amino acid transporter